MLGLSDFRSDFRTFAHRISERVCRRGEQLYPNRVELCRPNWVMFTATIRSLQKMESRWEDR